MRAIVTLPLMLWLSGTLSFLAAAQSNSQAGTLKFEAQVIWGTDAATSPKSHHKPVEADVEKKLKGLPLKWTHYFVDSRKTFELPAGTSKRVALNKECELEVKDLGKGRVEVTQFGKGENICKHTQPLPKGDTYVLAGNAPGSNSWLVVLKRLE